MLLLAPSDCSYGHVGWRGHVWWYESCGAGFHSGGRSRCILSNDQSALGTMEGNVERDWNKGEMIDVVITIRVIHHGDPICWLPLATFSGYGN